MLNPKVCKKCINKELSAKLNQDEIGEGKRAYIFSKSKKFLKEGLINCKGSIFSGELCWFCDDDDYCNKCHCKIPWISEIPDKCPYELEHKITIKQFTFEELLKNLEP